MNFKPLDKRSHWRAPQYQLEEDIVTSMNDERLAEITVPINEKRFEEQRKAAEVKAAEDAKKDAEA